jgi:hypothetical protein
MNGFKFEKLIIWQRAYELSFNLMNMIISFREKVK